MAIWAAVWPACTAAAVDGEFGLAEHLLREAFAVARHALADASHVADVGAQAVDHAAAMQAR